MGVDKLVVAGSYGFDTWSPEGGAIERQEDTGFAGLLGRFTDAVRHRVASVERALAAEPKRFLGALARCA
jgi:trehalose 6-phosphate phosphatase